MNEKTLLYLASGPIIPEYRDLPFGKMIFVDRTSQEIPFQDDRFEFIKADALIAIEQLLKRKIKIDYLVSVNEGLFGGGGNYPVLSDFMLGYLSPILSDEFFLVCDPKYYRAIPMYLNPEWGFKSSSVNTTDPNYIYPSLFEYGQRISNTPENPDFGEVYKLTLDKTVRSLQVNPDLDMKLIYGSIWDDADKLDLLGISLLSRHEIRRPGRNHFSISQFFREKGVYDLQGTTIQEIIAHAQANGLKRIGLSPWMDGEYAEVIQFLRDFKPGCIESIYFYHLRKRDFRQIYQVTQP
jgi:hypothetical protein